MDIQVLSTDYLSKSKNFLYPLVGLKRIQKFSVDTYLFWEKYTIENYHLIVKYTYGGRYNEFLEYCKSYIFPTLDKKGYLMESFDYEGQTIFILDISEWAMDVNQFLAGKYSKMTKDAKDHIINYHIYYKNGPKLDTELAITLEPNRPQEALGKKTGIEHLAEVLDIRVEELRKVGEIGSIYNTDLETLHMDDSLELVTESVKMTY